MDARDGPQGPEKLRSAAIPSPAGWGRRTFPAWRHCLAGRRQITWPDPHGEVAKQMAHCRAGVALLRPGKNTNGHSGTMGNTKIFEEMMAGLPVICTDFSLWREFVERYHCGVCVDPEDVDQVVLALRRLLEHPEEARQMGENGRRAVREAFNWSVEEQTLLGLYRDLSGSCDKGR